MASNSPPASSLASYAGRAAGCALDGAVVLALTTMAASGSVQLTDDASAARAIHPSQRSGRHKFVLTSRALRRAGW